MSKRAGGRHTGWFFSCGGKWVVIKYNADANVVWLRCNKCGKTYMGLGSNN